MRRNCVVCAALLAIVPAVQAAPLYGVASYAPFGNQGLYSIDAATGAATYVGDTGVSEINGIAWDSASQTLVAYTTDAELYALNLATGEGTLVADASGIVPEGDLAYAGGTWYATNASAFGTVDAGSAVFSMIGDMGADANDVSGLAVEATGAIYGYSKNGTLEDSLVGIDGGTGVATFIGLTGIDSSNGAGGLDFDPESGVLYLSDNASLYTVDTATGAATMIGAHGVAGMSGIAFVPEPGSLALLLGGLVVIRARR